MLGIFLRSLGVLLGTSLLSWGGAGWLYDFFARANNPTHPVSVAILNAATDTAGFLQTKWNSSITGGDILDLLCGRLPQIGEIPLWVLPALGLSIVLLSLILFRRDKPAPVATQSDAPEESSEKEQPLRKALAKRVNKLIKQGRAEEAGELLAGEGFKLRAAQIFEKAEQFERAGALYAQEDRFGEAGECFEKIEEFEQAGKMFAAQEDYKRAAPCYALAEKPTIAAEMFEKAGDFGKAAAAYYEAEYFRHAASVFVRGKNWRRAAESLERVLQEETSNTADSNQHKARRKLVLQAGKLYEQAGELDKASAILEKGACYVAAAEIQVTLGNFAQAGELFLNGQDPLRAAEAYESSGDDKKARLLRAEHYRDQGDLAKAAGLFEEAESFFEAAEVYRSIEDYDRAGFCYERDGQARQAAEMFVLGGDRRRAAENFEFAECFLDAAACYAEIGESEKEIELLERAGAFFRVGQSYSKKGKTEEAISVLQKVEADDPDYCAALHLLGELFRAKGSMPLAIKKLRQVVGDDELNRENLPSFYLLACCYEDCAQMREAAGLFEKILAFDYQYQDVEVRIEACREVLRQMPVGGATLAEGQGGQRKGKSRYEILGELGRGGMGIVYKAKDVVLDRTVAYKVLPNELRESPKALKNFLREAKSAAQLNHPNIVTVYDAGEQDGRFYITMEYAEGTTLKEILRSRNKISIVWVLHVLVQVCEALAFAHEKKIVHRDVKPANIMWTKEKQAKIMDFGLAKVIEEVRNHTTVVAGTPYYMSPEQTLGRNVDHRTDIYSLGVTLFELVTGSLPFREGNVPYHHVHTPAPDPRSINPSLPIPLARIITRCLEKDPAARFGTAREIVAAVRSAMAKRKTVRTPGEAPSSQS